MITKIPRKILLLFLVASATLIPTEVLCGENTGHGPIWRVTPKGSPLPPSVKSLANDLLRSGKTEAAIAEYRKAIALDPDSTALYFNLAVAYYAERDIPRTTATLEKLVSLDSMDTEAQYNLGCLYLYQGDTDAARRHFENARLCCELRKDAFFSGLITKNLEFINELGRLDPSAQGLFSLLLRNGLPPLSNQD